MLKKVLSILILFIMAPVFAGEYSDAIKNNDKVFLYLYTNSCSYCHKFAPIYEQLVKKYNNNCKFVKLDSNKTEGAKVAYLYNAGYVPFVLLIDNKTSIASEIDTRCLLNLACSEKVMDDFLR